MRKNHCYEYVPLRKLRSRAATKLLLVQYYINMPISDPNLQKVVNRINP